MRTCPQCGKQYADGVAYCEGDGTRLSTLDSSDSPQNPNIGRVLGSYRLLQLLGEGGMGQVYLGEHTRLGRKVALKLLRPEYARHTKAVQRFFGEARAVNQISHDNIVEITDFIENDVDAEGKPAEKYYIMELLRGRSLGDLQKTEGILPLQRTMPIMMQVCSALASVHEAGIVHRDLKPDNIFLIEKAGKTDFVKLLDFGVAKFTDLSASQQMGRTGVGALVGTPEYMSPEQMSGKTVDHRSDIYALGIIFYEVVTGRQPFTAKSLGEMAIKHLTVTPPKPSKLKDLPHMPSRDLEQLIMQCLQKDPLKRPQNVGEITERLTPIAAEIAGAVAGIESPVRRARNTRYAIAAGLSLCIVAGVGVMMLRSSHGQAQNEGMTPSAELAVAPAQLPVGDLVVPPTEVSPQDAALALEALPKQPAAIPKVQIHLDSTPSGAEVYRDGVEAPLGVTPFILSAERSDVAQVLEFRRSGYRSSRETVAFSSDHHVSTTLAKLDSGKPRRKTEDGKTERDPSSRGTIDPFAD
ncbi:MAG: serine/threonine protein kinase [Myxococcota bacterium]